MQMKTSTYPHLLELAEQHFSGIRQRNPYSFRCNLGCHQCCIPDLTVLTLEAGSIVQYLLARPELIENLRNLEHEDPHEGTRCSFLTKEGACGIYPVRPFICRSHGAPIAIAQEEYYQADVCQLNFTENPIEELGPEDFFILDEWNEELLSHTNSEERIPLRLSNLLKGTSK